MSDEEPLTLEDVDPMANKDPRYPHWHRWLSVGAQEGLCVLIYVVWLAWAAVYLSNAFGYIQIEPSYVALIPALNYALAAILLIGMVSTMTKNTWLGFISLLTFFGFINVWPRLAIPGFAGMMGAFFLYVMVYVVWQEGVVNWSNFGVPGYMLMIAPLIGIINMGLFKWYCSGGLPKFIYMNFAMFLMILGTIKEYRTALAEKDDIKKLQMLDYSVTLPVFRRLIAFRIGVLAWGFGVVFCMVQDSMLTLVAEGVWECTPKAW